MLPTPPFGRRTPVACAAHFVNAVSRRSPRWPMLSMFCSKSLLQGLSYRPRHRRMLPTRFYHLSLRPKPSLSQE